MTYKVGVGLSRCTRGRKTQQKGCEIDVFPPLLALRLLAMTKLCKQFQFETIPPEGRV